MKSYLILLIGLLSTACNNNPKNSLNQEATELTTDLFSEQPLLLKVLSSSINPKDSTMATLYANNLAWKYASNHQDADYPDGAILYQITWRQQPDSLWFGANIPKKVQSIERIKFTLGSQYSYERFEGNPLHKVAKNNVENVKSILNQHPVMTP